MITRGEHFCREALRLWLVEEGRESITNLQALAILAMTWVVEVFRQEQMGMLTFSTAKVYEGKTSLV